MDGNGWRRVHFWLIFVFIGIWAAAAQFGWLSSVVFVSHISMCALVLAEISSWQASRTEAKQDKQLEQNDQRDDIQDNTLKIDTDST